MNKKVPKIALSLLASYLFLVILMPVTKAEDLPLCTFNDFSCDEWSTCSPFNWPDTLVDGIKTRACHQINCQGLKPGEVAPEQTESCLFATPTCNSWTYSNWSACSSGGNQTRNIISSQPNNCVRGDPVLSQSCSYVPTCTINDWSCTDWSECSANGFKNRECNKTNCQNGVVSPAISQSCIYTAPIASCSADTWSCGDWNSCTTSGIQKRSCNKTFDCRTIATPSPLTTRSCVFETPVYQQPQIPQLNLNAKEEAVLKAVVQIQIWDLSLNKYISWGTGINIGGEFITNYHVAKMVITDPLRYAAFACVTTAINSEPDCKIKLSITKNILGKSIDSPKYNQNADLALLYVDKIRVNNKWKMGVDTVLSDWGVSSIILSEYVKNYGDINVGEHVYSIGYPDYGGGKTIIADGFVKKLITNSNGQKLMLNSIDISHGNSGCPVFNSKGELVGVTVACLLASPYADECKNYSGLFIPLPTLNWWYMDTTNSRISSIKGDATYLPNAGVTDEVANSALCVYPLRQNAYYNKTKRECSCETNYFKNNDGECVDTSGYVDPTLRYGKKIDLIKERDGFIVLNQNLSDLTEISKPPLTPCQAGYIGQGNDCISECQMVENLIQNGKISQDKVVAARAIASADTPGGCPLIAVPIIPTKTNAQICSEFMINSIWSGEKNDQGGLICDCKSGYQLNEQRTNCVITPVVPVIDRNQGCKDRYGTNSIWDGTKDNSGKYQCSCVEGYNWDEGNAQCIVNAAVTENKIDNSKTEVVKQKGFWSRVWGWFRF